MKFKKVCKQCHRTLNVVKIVDFQNTESKDSDVHNENYCEHCIRFQLKSKKNNSKKM